MDRSMIDAASGGALMDKTPETTRHLISNMASNTQQFGIKGVASSRMVNEVGVIDNLRLENQLTELTSLVRQLVGQHQPSMTARVCCICTSVEHPTNMCPILQETESYHPKSVGSIGGYQYEKQSYQSQPYNNLKKQVGQLPNTVSQLQSVGSENLPSQTILNPRGNTSVVSLRSGRELPQQVAPQQRLRPTSAESEQDVDLLVPQQARSIPLPFPT
ncbi:hypothetical protein CR513_32796, partial [Mucuna pruriens]